VILVIPVCTQCLQSTALSDLEGTGVAEASGGPAGGAFKVLKSLMAHWLHEAETNSNV
jgi:hypothetical protein